MLISACIKVAQNKDFINSINIFPVPDQDTGDNLSATLTGVYNNIHNKKFNSMEELKDSATDGAIYHASGNVGIITTGFLNSFLSNLTNDVTIKTFKKAFDCGLTSAFNSIQDPKEGTILDVIKAASESLSQSTNTDFEIILKEAISDAKTALDNTQFKMDLYTRASTVDAGGYGFLFMMEGFLDGFNNKKSINIKISTKSSERPTSFLQTISHRYEVVSLLESLNFSKKEITEKLIEYGDCIDIVEANEKLKIHIHTDLTDEVIDLISTFGSIINIKTTNMADQIEKISDSKKPIGIIVDSGAGLDLDFVTQNDVAIVPFKSVWEKVDAIDKYKNISVYQKMRIFKDKVEEYGWPKTSQPSPKAFLNSFKEQLQKYNHVFCITVSSSISGSYNSAIQARSLMSTPEQERIIIPDCKTIGPGQGLLAVETVKLINQEFTYKQIERKIPNIANNVEVFGAPENIVWLIKGGRFKANKFLVDFLPKINLKPVAGVSIKGVTLKRMYFTPTPIAIVLAKYLNKNYHSNNKKPLDIIIQHGDSLEGLENFKKTMDKNRFNIVQESIISPVLGFHTGPGTFIIGVLKN
jgi:DegV family protein with EDD domain